MKGPGCRVHLIGVEFHIHQRHSLVHATVVLGNSVHCFRDVFKNQIQVKLILVCGGKEAVLECHYVGMVQQSHDLKLSVLISFVLQDFLNRHGFSSLNALCLSTLLVMSIDFTIFLNLNQNCHLGKCNKLLFQYCNSLGVSKNVLQKNLCSLISSPNQHWDNETGASCESSLPGIQPQKIQFPQPSLLHS